MKEKFGVFDAVIYLLMGAVLISVLYPILNVVAISFSSSSFVVRNEVTIFPRGFTLDAYKELFSSSRIPRAYGNTLLYTGLGTGINLLMTILTAYPLSRPALTGRKLFMGLILFTIFFNGGTIPTFIVVQALGLRNTIWSMVLPNAIWTMELLILISFFRSVPQALHESAVLDGASEATILWRIFVPLSKASLASVGLFYFMGHWNSYFLPLIYLDDQKLYPLQLVLKDMLLDESATISNVVSGSAITPASLKNAVIFITMVPVMIIYPMVQKYFVKGVMIGSVKG
ncbi:carbohydrate ABC transporter permease [Ruthenibacterium lactatiformans]|uniref:carbohydrate ABC transporter permease n=1 Tax=Ruthenibacterium lactatiformans TaxID=1550024 RepID=UPI003FD73CB5